MATTGYQYGGNAATGGAGGGFVSASGRRGASRSRTQNVDGGLGVHDMTYDDSSLGADAQYELGMAPINYKRETFNKIFPLVTGLMGQGDSSSSFGRVGGENTPLPRLPNSFVYTPDAVQAQVNAARAQGDQGAFTQKQTIVADAGARGFGTRSPFAMASAQAADTGARMSNADQERQIRFDAAGANARQDLAVSGLANQQWAAFNQADVERRKTQLEAQLGQQRNMQSLLATLAGFA
jgi:hypothetical protein